jgi:acyl-CoA thioesterase-1
MNMNTVARKIFLKLCYFSFMILWISCGGKGESKTQNTTETTKTTATEVTKEQPKKSIVFFGDSLTAGYGLDDTNDAFPGVIQKNIDSLNLAYTVVNSGVSGETTAGGRGRINWVLNQEPTIFVLELGANDGLRGVPLSATRENLQAIIDAVKQKYPQTQIVLAGMQIPPNMGPEYTQEFRSIFPDLAQKNELSLIPFLLENVGGVPTLNQSDGIHPTEEGHRIVAQNVWPVLQPLLQP